MASRNRRLKVLKPVTGPSSDSQPPRREAVSETLPTGAVLVVAGLGVGDLVGHSLLGGTSLRWYNPHGCVEPAQLAAKRLSSSRTQRLARNTSERPGCDGGSKRFW